ncbi:MAG: hypothetical protein WBQ91_04905, partial [Candidatus Acidiferrum sp.]
PRRSPAPIAAGSIPRLDHPRRVQPTRTRYPVGVNSPPRPTPLRPNPRAKSPRRRPSQLIVPAAEKARRSAHALRFRLRSAAHETPHTGIPPAIEKPHHP